MTSSARTTATVPSPASNRPSRDRSWPRLLLAVPLLLTSLATGLFWASTADTAVTASLQAATHGEARGLTVQTHPDPYFVYTEDGTPVTGITVTTPEGATLPVTLTDTSFTYGPHREGRQVGTFQVPVGRFPEQVAVVVTTSDGRTDVPVAVTTFDVAGFQHTHLWVVGAILTVNVAVAVLVLVRPGRPARRSD